MDLEYGKGFVDVPVDPKHLLGVLQPQGVEGIVQVEESVRKSLEKPIGAPAFSEILKGKKKALILTVNFTRPSPKTLIHPIAELCDRMKVEVTILIARGRHRAMTKEEIHAHLGENLVRRYPVFEHDPFDETKHIEVGSTSRGIPIRMNRLLFEHDAVIGTGIIEPSYLCGFSGGRKLLMPGISHYKSIDLNHYLLLEKGALPGVLEGNPLSDDSEEAARKLPYHWITYSIVGAEDQVSEVVSGDPFRAHRFACEQSRRIFTRPRRLADIVVSSAGGYPYDCDMVQGKKALIPAEETVNPRGAIIVLAECQEGWGAEPTFKEWLTGLSPEEILLRVRNKALFSLGAHGAYLFAKPTIEKGVKVILVTNPQIVSDLRGNFVAAVSSPAEAMEIARRHTSEQATVTILRKSRRLILA